MSTSAERLRGEIDNELIVGAQLMRSFPWESKASYADWLAQTHYVAHATRLLATLASQLPSAPETLRHQFAVHVGEARANELLCIRDLDGLREHVSNYEERPSTLAFHSSQLCLMERHSPVALLGHLLFVEAIVPRAVVAIYTRVLRMYGKTASRLACRHVAAGTGMDIGGIGETLELLELLPADQQQWICNSFCMSADLYRSLIEQIVKGSSP